MPLPDSLAHKISLFEESAAAPDYQYGLFSRDSWLSVLFGQGVVPRGYNRLADRVPLAELEAKMRDLKSRIDMNVAAMSAHGDFIAGYCSEAATAFAGAMDAADMSAPRDQQGRGRRAATPRSGWRPASSRVRSGPPA